MEGEYDFSEGIRGSAMDILKVRKLGTQIGYGNIMGLASQLWGKEVMGGEFVVGPCKALTVPCVCKDYQLEGHCEWCNGCGWLTEAVRKLIDEKGNKS